VADLKISIHPDLTPPKTIEMVGNECFLFTAAHNRTEIVENSSSNCLLLQQLPPTKSHSRKKIPVWKSLRVISIIHFSFSRRNGILLDAGGDLNCLTNLNIEFRYFFRRLGFFVSLFDGAE
jgi:hypothetical protein